ncbi:hypothetical protein GCM10009565_79690 [Amycolatopsis albidoflavus]
MCFACPRRGRIEDEVTAAEPGALGWSGVAIGGRGGHHRLERGAAIGWLGRPRTQLPADAVSRLAADAVSWLAADAGGLLTADAVSWLGPRRPVADRLRIAW